MARASAPLLLLALFLFTIVLPALSQITATSIRDRVIHTQETIGFELASDSPALTSVIYRYWDKAANKFKDPDSILRTDAANLKLNNVAHFSSLEALYSFGGSNAVSIPSHLNLVGVWIEMEVILADKSTISIQALLITPCEYMQAFDGVNCSGNSICHPKPTPLADPTPAAQQGAYCECLVTMDSEGPHAKTGENCSADLGIEVSGENSWLPILDSTDDLTAIIKLAASYPLRILGTPVAGSTPSLHLLDLITGSTEKLSLVSNQFNLSNVSRFGPKQYRVTVVFESSTGAITGISNLPTISIMSDAIYAYTSVTPSPNCWNNAIEPCLFSTNCDSFSLTLLTDPSTILSDSSTLKLNILPPTSTTLTNLPSTDTVSVLVRSQDAGHHYYWPHLASKTVIEAPPAGSLANPLTITFSDHLVPGKWQVLLFFQNEPLVQCAYGVDFEVSEAPNDAVPDLQLTTKFFPNSFESRIDSQAPLNTWKALNSDILHTKLPPYVIASSSGGGNPIMVPLFDLITPPNALLSNARRPLILSNPIKNFNGQIPIITIPLYLATSIRTISTQATVLGAGCANVQITPLELNVFDGGQVGYHITNFGGARGYLQLGFKSSFVPSETNAEVPISVFTDQDSFVVSMSVPPIPADSTAIKLIQLTAGSDVCFTSPRVEMAVVAATCPPSTSVISLTADGLTEDGKRQLTLKVKFPNRADADNVDLSGAQVHISETITIDDTTVGTFNLVLDHGLDTDPIDVLSFRFTLPTDSSLELRPSSSLAITLLTTLRGSITACPISLTAAVDYCPLLAKNISYSTSVGSYELRVNGLRLDFSDFLSASDLPSNSYSFGLAANTSKLEIFTSAGDNSSKRIFGLDSVVFSTFKLLIQTTEFYASSIHPPPSTRFVLNLFIRHTGSTTTFCPSIVIRDVVIQHQCPITFMQPDNEYEVNFDQPFVFNFNIPTTEESFITQTSLSEPSLEGWANVRTIVNSLASITASGAFPSAFQSKLEADGFTVLPPRVPFAPFDDIKFTLQYADCLSQIVVKFIFADEMLGTVQQVNGRSLTLGWIMPHDRALAQLNDPAISTIFYNFSLYQLLEQGDVESHSIATLSGSVRFTDPLTGELLPVIGNKALVAFPDTASQVVLEFPRLPKDAVRHGFVVRMEGAHGAEPSLDFTFNADEYPDPCGSITPTCNSATDECNAFTQQCERKLGLPALTPISLFNSNGKCTLSARCPRYFTPNEACTQCVCISVECRRRTMSFQIQLQSLAANTLTTKQDLGLFILSLRTKLKLSLGLSILPKGSYPEYRVNGLPEIGFNYEPPADSPATPISDLGFIDLFINLLNPSQSPPYFYSSLLITVTISPLASGTSRTALEPRFADIKNKLTALIKHNIEDPYLEVGQDFPGYLPFSVSFSPLTSGTLTSFNAFSSPQGTQCSALKTTTTAPGACPPPNVSLFTSSPYWSECANDFRTISPFCRDYLSLAPAPGSNWCGPGWFNYPSISRVTGCAGQQTLPSAISWTTTSPPIPISSGSMVTLEWVWGGSNADMYTIDILFSSSTTAYSQLVATAHAAEQKAMVIIPKLLEDAPGATFRLRCTQNITTRSPNLAFPVTATNLCPANNQCQSRPGSRCNPDNGQCECLAGFVQNTDPLATTNQCQPLCLGLCKTESDCTTDSPDVCKACPDSFAGDLCKAQIGFCSNNNLGFSSLCSGRGFVPLSGDNTDCSELQCACPTQWGTKDCSKCMLLEEESDNTVGKCVLDHTDIQKTTSQSGSNCSECVCLPGYYGLMCEISTIRSHAVFQNALTTGSNIAHNPLSTEDPNGLHFVSEGGRGVLARDTALSIGLTPDLINIISIHQAVVIPTAASHANFIPTATPDSYTQTVIRYSIQPTALGGFETVRDLSTQWSNLTPTTLPQLPINDGEIRGEVGHLTGVGDPVMPGTDMGEVEMNCPAGRRCDCAVEDKLSNGGYCPAAVPKSSSSSSTPIIIGVVVGVVAVILLFVIAVLVVRWAKKNQRCCFNKTKGKQASKTDSNKNLELSQPTVDTQHSSALSGKGSAKSASSTAVDLVPVEHNEDLPDGWSKQKHTVTGDEFYVYIKDGEMKSQHHSPLTAAGGGSGW